MKNEFPNVPVDNSIKYMAHVDELRVHSRRESGAVTNIILESPLAAEISVDLDGYDLVINGIVKNENSFSWYYPNDPYQISDSFVLRDGKGKLIAASPRYDNFGFIDVTDSMFIEVDPFSEFHIQGKISLNSIVGQRVVRNRLCATFGNTKLPPKLAEELLRSDAQGTSRSIMLSSKTVCFDLVRNDEGLFLENVGE
ncbi:MAG: hypothetical protein ACTHZI_03370 [Luteimonas sp.]